MTTALVAQNNVRVTRRQWTPTEDAALVAARQVAPHNAAGWQYAMARTRGVTVKAVERRLSRLLPRYLRRRMWTLDEDNLVLGWRTPLAEMADHLRRTTKGVERRVWRLRQRGELRNICLTPPAVVREDCRGHEGAVRIAWSVNLGQPERNGDHNAKSH